MKILHTVPSLRPETGGPARSVPGLAQALAIKKLQVTLWSPDFPSNFTAPDGVGILRGPMDAKTLRAERFDLIHDHGLWLPSNHSVANMARWAAIPRVVSPRGMLEPWALQHKKWKKRIAWHLYQRRDLASALALHATAESEADQFQRLGLKRPTLVIPNGVELPPTAPREGHSDTSKFKTALFLSRIHPKKGLPMLIEAWSTLRPREWRMRIIGPDEGGHRAELEALVNKAGLSGSWSFDGPLEGEAKKLAFDEAQLFILPTYSENFGIAVAEAMAHGLPVITTHGAPWRCLETDKCGWWVPADKEGITNALYDATKVRPEDLVEMGRRGRRFVAEHFSWNGIAHSMAQAYEKLLTPPSLTTTASKMESGCLRS